MRSTRPPNSSFKRALTRSAVLRSLYRMVSAEWRPKSLAFIFSRNRFFKHLVATWISINQRKMPELSTGFMDMRHIIGRIHTICEIRDTRMADGYQWNSRLAIVC